MIKRLLLAALLGVIALPAGAAMNIRQSGDGTANWQGQSTGTFSNCVGATNHNFIVDLNNATPQFQPVIVDRGIIKNVWATSFGTSAGVALVSVFTGSQSTYELQFANAGVSLVTNATLRFDAGTVAGTTKRISTIGEVTGATQMISNTVSEGEYIRVASDGGGTTAGATATVLIQVCPR